MTPARFDAELRAWKRKERRMAHRFATIASLIANSKRDPKKCPRPFMPEDFISEEYAE